MNGSNSRFEMVNTISRQVRTETDSVGMWETMREKRIADAKAYFGRAALTGKDYVDVDGQKIAAAIESYRRRERMGKNVLCSLLGVSRDQLLRYEAGDVTRIRVSTFERFKRFGVLS